MSLTRRGLIGGIARAGGIGAAYRAMEAMGLVAIPEAYAGPPDLEPNSGAGTRVLILGAGMAGMVAAWELGRAGYDVAILEARPRAGGRNWSLRAGDEVLEMDSVQHVRWDIGEHLYVNPGPARIPYHHAALLAYCRELNVPLEVMCNDDRAALLQDDAAFEGKPQLNRAVVNDSRGYIAELAAKAVDRKQIDSPVTAEDGERLRGFLRAMGALDRDLAYRGSSRSGWATPPGTEPGKPNAPLDFRQLLASDFWQGKLFYGELSTQAATMMQPVGGMGRIGQTFARKLGPVIVTQAEVTRLRRDGAGARVEWKDMRTGAAQSRGADLVLCTIPASVLREIDTDFPEPIHTALGAIQYVPAGKLAWQASRRFWELDDAIYGGISWTSRDSTQVWYPSAGIHQRKGILLGAYIWDDDKGHAFAAKPPDQRSRDAVDDLERLHPGARTWLEKPVSVAWPNIPYSRGAWAEYTPDARATAYPTLLNAEPPYLFAGEHVSWITGWQEGAIRSAQFAVQRIARYTRAKKT